MYPTLHKGSAEPGQQESTGLLPPESKSFLSFYLIESDSFQNNSHSSMKKFYGKKSHK